MPAADGRLERRQVDLVEGALVDDRVREEPVEFLVVRGVVLDDRDHVLGLQPVDVPDGDAAREERVLPYASDVRPPTGTRMMLIVGPFSASPPKWRTSSPTTVP